MTTVRTVVTNVRINTHHWVYRIEVRNDFRGSQAHLRYQWFSELAAHFEAVWAGASASGNNRDYRIRVLLNGREVGAYTSKAEAWGSVRKLLDAAPPLCAALFAEYAEASVKRAIFG